MFPWQTKPALIVTAVGVFFFALEGLTESASRLIIRKVGIRLKTAE
jgi:hypothetical protein